MRPRIPPVRLACLLVALAGIPLFATAEDRAQSAILITVDTLRADALGFAGNAQASTPALDRLAASGRVFANTHAHSVTTLPSHASILTGLYPYQHGARHNGGFVLSPDVATLTATLQDAGFATAAFVAAFPLDARFGLDQGFDVYDDDLGDPYSLFRYSERRGDQVVALARKWWQEHQGQQRFLWLHLFEPHAPYEPIAPFDQRFASQPYLGEVATVDAYLAPLLEGFLGGKEAPTLIAFTSDHGESLGEHGEATHGLFAYEATLKVPLVLWGPGVERGVDKRPARHVDLKPTFLEALGLPAIDALPGRSLLQDAADHPDVSFFEALSGNLDYGWAPLRGVMQGGEKLIALPLVELYDVVEDPAEANNLYTSQRTRARELSKLLPQESSWPPAAGELSEEEASRLRSLGYLGGPTEKKKVYTVDDDPKRLVELDHAVGRLADLAERGETRAAIRVARDIVEKRPSMGVVYVYLSTLLIRSGEPEEAITVMRRAEQLDLAGTELLRQLGLTLIQVGRAKEALGVLVPLVEDASDAEARNHHALAKLYLGRVDEAEKELQSIAADHPEVARTFENLSFLAITRQRFSEARDQAFRALALDAGLVSSWNNLGIALYNLGSAKEAIEAWKKGLAIDPDDRETLLNSGLVEAAAGDPTLASRKLRRFLELAVGPAWEAKRRQASEALKQLGGSG